MLTEDQLRQLMRDRESDRVERTITTKKFDKFGQAICAFANDLPGHRKPGYLLVGVNDDGSPAGLTITDEILKDLDELRASGKLLPVPTLTVEKITLGDGSGEVAVVEILPSDLPPVRFDSRVWIRVGPRKATASEADERLLIERRTAQARTFDARPCHAATLQDLVPDLFLVNYRLRAFAPEVIEENHRSLEHQLASLRFFDQTRNCPTNAGVLLFGAEPRSFLDSAYIQFLRFAGTELEGDVSHSAELSGDLLTILRGLDALIPTQLAHRRTQETLLRERHSSQYPPRAIRELLLNALIHRQYEASGPIRFYWFDDRIEIQSPGGLYGEATPENFPERNAYRNPVLAEALQVLGYVERFGRGLALPHAPHAPSRPRQHPLHPPRRPVAVPPVRQHRHHRPTQPAARRPPPPHSPDPARQCSAAATSPAPPIPPTWPPEPPPPPPPSRATAAHAHAQAPAPAPPPPPRA